MNGLAPRAIVIGASAGAVEALSALLPSLPADYALPILIVVHLPPDRSSAMAELFQRKCALPVREAEDKEPIRDGVIYFAPPDYHMLVERNGALSLANDEHVHYSRPSIDVLFESAADAFGPRLIGVLLTGANQDGAKGLAAIAAAGGRALVQEPSEAFARAMPEAAVAEVPTARVLPLVEIGRYLLGVGAP